MPVVPKNTLTAQALDAKFARRQRHYSISFIHQPALLPPGPERREPLLAPQSPQAPAQPEGSSAASAAWRAATADATPDGGAHEPAASTPPRHGHLSLAPEPSPAPEPPQAPAQPEGSSATFAAWRDAAETNLNLGSDPSEPHEQAAAAKTPLRSKHPARRTLLGTSAVALTCMIASGAYYSRADWMPVAATTAAGGTDPGNPVAPARDLVALPAPEATTEIPPAQHPDPQPAAAPRPALSAASAAAQATPGLRWTAPAPAPASASASRSPEAGTPSPAPASPTGTAEARPVVMRGPTLAVPSPQRPQMPATPVITVKAPPVSERSGTTTASTPTPTSPNPALPAAPPPALAAETSPASEQPAATEAAGGGAEAAAPNPADQQLTSTLTLVKQIAMLVHDIQDENSKYRARTDTLQTKTDALQTRDDELSKRMDAVAAENTRLHAQVRVLAGRMQSRPVAYQPRPGPEARP